MATRRAGILLLLILGLYGCSPGAAATNGSAGQTRTYYIAADDVTWDYVPGAVNGITGEPFKAAGFFRGGPRPDAPPVQKPVSTSYMKTLYQEYTDNTFKTLKPRPAAWAHLGFVGPVIRGEVGDTIKVVFRNNGQKPYSIHPHGVFYNKDSEGAPYADGTSGAGKADDGVPPGGTHEYLWQVPERAGPGPHDGNSVLWMYHSHVDEVRDPNTGLMGPMIVTGRGQSNPDGTPKGVDREFVVMFAQVHEEGSWFVDKNVPTATRMSALPPPFAEPNGTDQNIYPYFVTFSINGYSHGSLPLGALTMRKGEHVRWYIFANTNDFDAHTPHWHGNTVLINEMRTDVASLLPMSMTIADMVPDNVGTWLMHCHVSFHNTEGMNARYAVTP